MKAFIYFYRTFLSTGIQNVLPQLFIIAYAPTRRSELLPLCLLLASLSSIGGIVASRRMSRAYYGGSDARRAALAIILSALSGTALAAMFLTREWLAYLIAVATVSGLLELLFNMLDHRYVSELTGAGIKAHASRVTVVQLVAVTAAPFYFSFTADVVWPQMLLAAGGTAMLAVAAFRSGSPIGPPATLPLAQANASCAGRPAEEAKEKRNASGLQPRDVAFLLYALLVYVAVFVFSAHLIYILRDYYEMSGAAWKGGLLLGFGNLVAVACVLGYSRLRSAASGRSGIKANGRPAAALPIGTHAAIAGCLLVSAALLYERWIEGFAFLLLMACLVGGAFGLFQLLAREYASRRAVGEGAAIVLTSYNNLKNVASLAGFGAALLLASVSARLDVEYVRLVLLAVLACALAASLALAVVPALGNARKEENG